MSGTGGPGGEGFPLPLLLGAVVVLFGLAAAVAFGRRRGIRAYQVLLPAFLVVLVFHLALFVSIFWQREGWRSYWIGAWAIGARSIVPLAVGHLLIGVVALVLGLLVVRRGSMTLAAPGAMEIPHRRGLSLWEAALLGLGGVAGIGIYWATFFFS